jgi:signal transduction histidine kinase
MRLRFDLRARFVAALLLFAAAVAGGFGVAVFQFIEVLESELQERLLQRELTAFAEEYRRDPTIPPPDSAGLDGYIVRPGKPSRIPPEVERIEDGNSAEIQIGGTNYVAARRDVADARLYLMLDISNVEALEDRLITLALVFVLASLVAAVSVAIALSRLVTRPVSRLADLVTSLDPSDRGLSLRATFDDRDVGMIAAAFDRYLQRLDEFVTREQAFSDVASHELRTPLAIVLSGVQLLLEEQGLTERGRERLERIHRAALQMNGLIEALLFLARENDPTTATTCALDEVLRAAVDTHREAAAKAALELHCEIAAPQSVGTSAVMANAVVGNLIANAIRHAERGRIDVRLESGRFSVQDTGRGIPAGELARIFDFRYRGQGSGGMGLGLYLVKLICDRLGWRIQASSVPGAGTRFEVVFPPAS